MGKIILLGILIYLSFSSTPFLENREAILWAGWIIWIGWILQGSSKKEKPRKKKRYYFEEDDDGD